MKRINILLIVVYSALLYSVLGFSVLSPLLSLCEKNIFFKRFRKVEKKFRKVRVSNFTAGFTAPSSGRATN